MITARQQVPSDCTDTKADKPHYAVILRRGKIPIQKKLPEFAAPVIEQLIREFPTALIAIVDADGREITVWSPAEVAAMARQFNAETVVQEVTPLINEPITPPIREFINRFQIAGHIKSSYFSMIAIH